MRFKISDVRHTVKVGRTLGPVTVTGTRWR